jgi:transposase
MYITVIPNRNSPPAVLLREGYREDGKVKNRTLANLSHLAPEKIEALKAVLKGAPVGAEPIPESSLPHGHVLAVTGMMRKLGLDTLLNGKRHPMRERALALIAGRILDPSSKLALAQSLAKSAEHSTLGEVLGLGELGKAVTLDPRQRMRWRGDESNKDGSQEKRAAGELYAAMDWLLERQEKIENALARKHLGNGCTVLYDLSSSYFEGRCCPLAKHGYSRDHRGDRPQINYGLLCSDEGVPVAIEVVEGNVGDPATIPAQVAKLKARFGLERVVVVGDRGMVTEARIREDISTVGYDWISALRHGAIRTMVEARVITPSLFDARGIAEIAHPDYLGERLIACFNPIMHEERTRKREVLLQLTEKALRKVADACTREKQPLEGKGEIGMKAGAVLSKFKVGKYFRVHVGDHSFRFARNQDSLDRDAAMDGIYVIRTSVPKEVMAAEKAVLTYKQLSRVERAFRTLKSVDLQIRPIYHYAEDRVKAHMFLCMLAYYVEFHLRKAWAELLYTEEEGPLRTSPVAPVQPSPSGREKKAKAHGQSGLPLQSFQGLLKSLATLAMARIRLGDKGPLYTRTTKPTPLQARAFELIGVEVA